MVAPGVHVRLRMRWVGAVLQNLHKLVFLLRSFNVEIRRRMLYHDMNNLNVAKEIRVCPNDSEYYQI